MLSLGDCFRRTYPALPGNCSFKANEKDFIPELLYDVTERKLPEGRLFLVLPARDREVLASLKLRVLAYLHDLLGQDPISERLFDLLPLIYMRDAYAGTDRKLPFSYELIDAFHEARIAKARIYRWLLCSRDHLFFISRRNTSGIACCLGWRGWLSMFLGATLAACAALPFTYFSDSSYLSLNIGIFLMSLMGSFWQAGLGMILTGMLGFFAAETHAREAREIDILAKWHFDAAQELRALAHSSDPRQKRLVELFLYINFEKLKKDFLACTTQPERVGDLYGQLETTVNYLKPFYNIHEAGAEVSLAFMPRELYNNIQSYKAQGRELQALTYNPLSEIVVVSER